MSENFSSADENTDDILSFVTDSAIAKDLIDGKKNRKLYRISPDEDNDYKIVDFKTFTLDQQKENRMSLLGISDELPDYWDLLITFYYKSGYAVFKCNQSGKMPTTTKKRDWLDFYIVKKNSPDILLDKISVPYHVLVNESFVAVDINELLKYSSLDQVEVLTRRIVRDYCVVISNQTFDVESEVDHTQTVNLSRYLSQLSNFDLQIKTVGKKLIIDRPENFDYVRKRLGKSNSLQLFSVGPTVDHLRNIINIDFQHFAHRDQIEIPLSEKPDLLLSSNRLLKISYIKEGESSEPSSNI